MIDRTKGQLYILVSSFGFLVELNVGAMPFLFIFSITSLGVGRESNNEVMVWVAEVSK